MTTELLALDEIVSSQAQKEVTHNTALRQIEGRLIRVLSRTTTAEPASPNAGDTYVVPASATGTNWSGQDGKIAHYFGGAWTFYAPIEGLSLHVNDEDIRIEYNGAAWQRAGGDLSAASAIAVGASPFAHTNNGSQDVDIIIQGGTVTLAEFGRGGSWYDVGTTSGIVRLSAGDSVRVTYSAAPTMVKIPR